MKSVIVLSLVIVFMFVGYLVYIWLQKLIQPRRSFIRLLIYFLFILAFIFVLSFLMVLIISKLYPDELMK